MAKLLVALLAVCSSLSAMCLTMSSAGDRPRILVVGGSGRVGGSTVRWLHHLGQADSVGRQRPPPQLVVGGRDRQNFERMRERWRRAGGGMAVEEVEFAKVDIEDEASIESALGDVDAVVHTAGPFQGLRRATVLEAAIRRGGITYVDVCDETTLVRDLKARAAACERAGVSAVVSCGIWPGASALLAMDCIDRLPANQPVSIDFSFFTAGTGNAGNTIVSATFLLLVTPALVYQGGEQCEKQAWTEEERVDFGGSVGLRTVRLLDCPDVLSVAETVKQQKVRPLASASSRFATAPEIWNVGFGAAKALLPQTLLADRRKMQQLAVFSEPIIRIVDRLVGSTNVMLVKASTPTQTVRALHHHDDLEAAVGIATAAFTIELLDRRRAPPSEKSHFTTGLCWPAELDPEIRAAILRRILDAPGTIEYTLA